MTTLTETKTTQVYRVFIKATPEAIWEAITVPSGPSATATGGSRVRPAPRRRYTGEGDSESAGDGHARRGGDGEVIEADPPHKLVHTWRFLWTERSRPRARRASRSRSRTGNGVSSLTVTHELENAPQMAA